ncbi:MAG: hypothetical protein EBU47_08140, partial [Betaproteobacteria bacterium]|nr:hypothetical protein [Betaproteobacteria bacterium]
MYPLDQTLPQALGPDIVDAKSITLSGQSGRPIHLPLNQITVPLGPYLPWKLETKTLDRLMIRLLVLGHLDRATTDRAADIASSSLLAAAEELRSG